MTPSLTNLNDDFLDDMMEPKKKKEAPKEEKVTFEKKTINKEDTKDV